jgi:hypothetical protein
MQPEPCLLLPVTDFFRLSACLLKTTCRYFRIDRRQIAYVKFILEAYEGLAVLSTVDPERGVVKLHIAPGCEDDVAGILSDLGNHLMIRPVSEPA